MRQSWRGFASHLRACPDIAVSRRRGPIIPAGDWTTNRMAERVFIRVVGFTDVERHALNTVFRLSEENDTHYSLWTVDAPELAQLALLDGGADEARREAESALAKGLHLVWVGDNAPEGAWRSFQRPIAWTEVVQAMDQLFGANELDFDVSSPVDLDLGGDGPTESGGPDTQPSQLPEPGKRALIASADRDERLYLRAKLALADLCQADEAESAAEALELLRNNAYEVALVDFGLPGDEGWRFLKHLKAQQGVPHVIVTKDGATVAQRVRAWFAGAEAFLDKPPDPIKLRNLLQRV